MYVTWTRQLLARAETYHITALSLSRARAGSMVPFIIHVYLSSLVPRPAPLLKPSSVVVAVVISSRVYLPINKKKYLMCIPVSPSRKRNVQKLKPEKNQSRLLCIYPYVCDVVPERLRKIKQGVGYMMVKPMI